MISCKDKEFIFLIKVTDKNQDYRQKYMFIAEEIHATEEAKQTEEQYIEDSATDEATRAQKEDIEDCETKKATQTEKQTNEDEELLSVVLKRSRQNKKKMNEGEIEDEECKDKDNNTPIKIEKKRIKRKKAEKRQYELIDEEVEVIGTNPTRRGARLKNKKVDKSYEYEPLKKIKQEKL